MGASVSVSGSRHGTCMFVDEMMLKDEIAFKRDVALRKNFIEFIKGGAWADCLDNFEDFLGLSYDSSETAWKRFGYKPPTMSDAPSTRSSFESSIRSSSTDYSGEACSAPNFVYQKMVLEDCYTAISTSNLFEKNELRPILFAALLPFFKQTFEEHGGPHFNSGDGALLLNDKPFKRPKKDRLQALLLGAAAMFDASELEAYLADPKVKWVDDYRKAISNLPVIVSVSTVDTTAQESKIVYSNAAQTSFFGVKTKTQVGENLHEVFSANCSSSGVEQIQKAVFSARKYKRGILAAENQCQLRALKPVFDSQGQQAFVLGLESRPFEDPNLSTKSGSNASETSDEPFQQVDDLLLLLPLLLKTG
uniref:PAS domain-containing protein n=1 Tax=Spumella elongata TaxID=89044 RepID=A0A7S3GX30_9STRA|mmetsp:Transcript_23566/g.40718  ORF Transcript_23566/g.40718 Transcript_23566/m.40718 type:complete len:363 (+) Transcript_23566:30-1118(+)